MRKTPSSVLYMKRAKSPNANVRQTAIRAGPLFKVSLRAELVRHGPRCLVLPVPFLVRRTLSALDNHIHTPSSLAFGGRHELFATCMRDFLCPVKMQHVGC